MLLYQSILHLKVLKIKVVKSLIFKSDQMRNIWELFTQTLWNYSFRWRVSKTIYLIASNYYISNIIERKQIHTCRKRTKVNWNFRHTGCPTSILPFSKAYFTKTKAVRWKIPTVLGVSWSAISYEKKNFFENFWKKDPSYKNWSKMAPPIKVPYMK